MAKRDAFKEFIEGLPQLNGFKGDPDARAVDDALAYWIKEYRPKGFKLNDNRRNLIIASIKKKHELFDLIINSDFCLYLDAVMEMIRQRVVWREAKRARKANREADGVVIMREIYREIVVLGYCLGFLKKQNKKKKNRKKPPG